MTLLEAVVQERPEREARVWREVAVRFVVASDASLERPLAGKGGFLVVLRPGTSCEERLGFVVDIPQEVYALGSGGTVIAQLELMLVLNALTGQPELFRHRRGTWFADNTAALMALVRGKSNQPDLDMLAKMIHIAMFSLRVWIYFEWIESKANWADGISRQGAGDLWLRRHAFAVGSCAVHLALWRLPFTALLRVTAFV